MWKAWGKAAAASGLALCAFAACARAPSVDVPKEAIVRLSDAFSSEFDLVGVDGTALSNESFRGRPMVVYFGFATCPDVCPLALQKLSSALDLLPDRDRADLAPLFITVDPARDTPEMLKAYLAFDDRLIGLTGSAAAIDRARQSFKVFARRQPLPNSALGYTMDHSSLFYLVSRDGSVPLALHDTLTPEELAEMLRRTIRS